MKFIGNILKRILLLSGLIVILSSYMCCEIYAFGTYFNQSQLSKEDKERKLGYLKIRHINQGEVDEETVGSFDVSQDDTIMAVGYSNNKIGVYSTDGQWLWGVIIEGKSGPIDCEIDDIDNSLLLIYARGEVMYKLNEEIQNIDVVTIDCSSNGDIYPYLELTRPKIRGGRTYKMNSSRVWVEVDGKKQILLDHSEDVMVQTISAFVVFGLIVAFALIMLKDEWRKKKENNCTM